MGKRFGHHYAAEPLFLLANPWASYISHFSRFAGKNTKEKNRCDICLCYTLNAPKKHHIVDKSIIFKHFQYLLAFSQIQGCDSSQRVPKALQPFNYSKFYFMQHFESSWLENPLEVLQEDMIHVRIRGS